MKIYTYKNCSTCKKAVKWLDAQGLSYEELPIRETPPKEAELKAMLNYYDGETKKLFNTAGGDYRKMDMKNRLPKLSETEVFELLTTYGNLVKRPFLLGAEFGAVGFKEAEWEDKVL